MNSASARPAAAWLRRHRKPALLLAAAIIVLLGVVWQRFGAVHTVDGLELQRRPFAEQLSAPATLDALTRSALTAALQGRLQQLFADQGQHVEAGQLLARLDARELDSAVQNATAQVEVSRRSIDEARADLGSAEANLHNANAQLARIEQLRSSGHVSAAELDQARADALVAKAATERARTAIPAAQAALGAAEASLQYQRVLLDHTALLAPFAGIITQRTVSPGDIVGPGTPIFELVDPASVIISARVDETALGKIGLGQAAQLRFRSLPGQTFTARISRIAQQVDSETREVVVELRPEGLPEQWAIGQRADVWIEVGQRHEALILPQSYVAHLDQQTGAWCLLDQRVRFCPLQLGGVDGESVEVLAGLAPGAVVIRPGQVRADTRVRLRHPS